MDIDTSIKWFSHVAEEFHFGYKYKKDFIERYKIWTVVIAKYSDKNNIVLDIGCGSGIFSFYAAEYNLKVIGVDASSRMINLCKAKLQENQSISNLSFFNCDINQLNNLMKEEIDLIICSSVLEYVEDLNETIEIMSGLLNNYGTLIFSMPNKLSLYRLIELIAFKFVRLPIYYRYVRQIITLNKMTAKLKNYGFNVVEHVYYARTPLLSHIGLPKKYTDNLFLIVAQR